MGGFGRVRQWVAACVRLQSQQRRTDVCTMELERGQLSWTCCLFLLLGMAFHLGAFADRGFVYTGGSAVWSVSCAHTLHPPCKIIGIRVRISNTRVPKFEYGA